MLEKSAATVQIIEERAHLKKFLITIVAGIMLSKKIAVKDFKKTLEVAKKSRISDAYRVMVVALRLPYMNFIWFSLLSIFDYYLQICCPIHRRRRYTETAGRICRWSAGMPETLRPRPRLKMHPSWPPRIFVR